MWKNTSPDRKKNKTIHRRKRNKRKEHIMISNVLYQSINHIFIEGDNNKEMWAEAKKLEKDYEILEIIYKWRKEQPRLRIYAKKNEIQKTLTELRKRYDISEQE